MSMRYKSINKTSVIQMYLILKFDKFFRFFHTKNFRKQRQPKWLTFTLFISLILPIFRKLFCGNSLICNFHHNNQNDIPNVKIK